MATTAQHMTTSFFGGGAGFSGHYNEYSRPQVYTPAAAPAHHRQFTATSTSVPQAQQYRSDNPYASSANTATGTYGGSSADYSAYYGQYQQQQQPPAHQRQQHTRSRTDHHHSRHGHHHHSSGSSSSTYQQSTYGGAGVYSKYSALLRSSDPIPTSNLKEHDPLDKKALDSWRIFKQQSRREVRTE
jgi:hypothetical protein